jgi:hypothetical protein
LGLLIEEQRANLILQSEDFSTTWTATATNVTTNTIIAPDGNLTGDKVFVDTANAWHRVVQNISVTSGTTYTLSVYAKKAEQEYIQLHFQSTQFGDSNSGNGAVFNLSTGAISAQGASLLAASITNVGNGWYRCSITKAATSTGTTGIPITLVNQATFSTAGYTGDGYSGIYIWGAQLESSSFSTSYIPTVASQVTRAADAASMTGTNFSSWSNAAEGTFFAQFRPAAADFGGNKNIFLASDGTTSNFVGLRYPSTGTQTALASTTSAVVQANVANGAIVAGTSYKLAGAYKANDFAASRDAGTVGTDTSGTIPVVTQAEIGMLAGIGVGSQHIAKLVYYPRRLANSELRAITA